MKDKLLRLWQPRRLLFWQMLLFNALSMACGWALRHLPLNVVGGAVVILMGLLNGVFGLLAAWALVRQPPVRGGTSAGGRGTSSASKASTSD